jgi:3-hydroxybutyryl-CoA dehydrogenase
MEGLSSASEIDTGMTLGYNHPMGPLALADFIGLDICLHILETLYAGFGDPKYRPCPVIRQLVAAGHLGKKTGKGFYEYGG